MFPFSFSTFAIKQLFMLLGIAGCDDFCSCDVCFASTSTSPVTKTFDLLPKQTRAAAMDDFKLKNPSQLCSSIIRYNDTLQLVQGLILI